jgi:adenylate cyclase
MAEQPARRVRPATDELTGDARARATVSGVVRLQIVANSLGVIAVALYFGFLFPAGADNALAPVDLNVEVFAVYLAAMILLALPLNAFALRRAVSWVRDGTPPTERQRKLVLQLPLVETASAFLSWIGAAALFGLINRDVQRTSVGIVLAGVVTCAFLYLLLEGHFRPLFALALADADLPEDRRDVLPRLMLAWLLGSGVPMVAVALSEFIGPAPLDSSRLVWIAGVSVAAGGLVMGVAARSVSRPLLRVRDAMREIELGDVEVQVPVDDLGELGRLAEGVNHLAAGVREREALRELFNRQVGQRDLADLALNAAAPLQGERREVTVLFVDLRGYTRFAERHPPEEVVTMLNRFFRVVVAVVNREGGWVNKFEGDAALCLFGAPQHQPDHADRALRAAASLPRELARTDSLAAGIGVASGEVIAGFVGTAERFEYTVIGDVVNVASRLCDEAKNSDSGVLAASGTIESATVTDEWTSAGRLAIRGRREKARVFTLHPTHPRRSRWYGTPLRSRAERSAP